MVIRGTLMNQAYFDREASYDDEAIPKFERLSEDENKTPEHRAMLKYNVFKKRLHALILRYSRGDAVMELKSRFPKIVSAWERYLVAPHGKKIEFSDDASTLENYVVSIWMVSLAQIFEIDAALFDRLLKCIDNEGKDKLFERIVAQRVRGRRQADMLVFPKIYGPLYDAIDAKNDERDKLFRTFLINWYKNMKPTYWHDCHKGPQGGGFFGYWAIEAAGVVKTFGVDDTAFRDMPYYPRDFI